MIKYNFDDVISRENSCSAKIDETASKFGKDGLIPMWIADMDYKAADPILDALNERVAKGVFGYTSRPNEYFEAVKSWQTRMNNWEPDIKCMSFALGVLPMLSTIFHAFLKQGEKVIIQPPVFQEFKPVIECWGGEVVVNQLIENDGDYKMNLVELEKLASEGAKFMILCHPHNPLGRVWTREELEDVGRICIKHNVTIISDEIYSDLMLFGNKHIPFASISEEFSKNCITCTSASKTFNLSGLQVATVIFPNVDMKDIYDKVLYKQQTYRNNVFSVIANTVAMNECEDWYRQVIQYIEGNVKFASDFINNNIPKLKAAIPQSTYLLWVDCRELHMSGDELYDFMIEEAGLALNDGRIFGQGGEGFMRINAGCSRVVLEKALNQLKSAVDKYIAKKNEDKMLRFFN